MIKQNHYLTIVLNKMIKIVGYNQLDLTGFENLLGLSFFLLTREHAPLLLFLSLCLEHYLIPPAWTLAAAEVLHITFFTLFIIFSTELLSILEKANHFLPKSFNDAPK